MTVSSSLARVAYATNGTQGPYPVLFYFLESSHLQVSYRDAGGVTSFLTLGTDYTVSGAGEVIGGSISTTASYPAGGVLTIVRSVPATQLTDFRDNDALPAEVLERAIDKLTMLIQQQAEQIARALLAPEGSGVAVQLPWPLGSALIGWNAEGTALENKSAADIAATITGADWRTEFFSGDGSTVAFTLQEDPGSPSNCDVTVEGLPQHAGKHFTVTGKVLTFINGNVPAFQAGGNNIAVRYGRALPQVGSVGYHEQPISTITGLQAALDGKLSLAGGGTVTGAFAVSGPMASGPFAAASMVSGRYDFKAGSLGSQAVITGWGPSSGLINLWQQGIEADRSFSMWRYDDSNNYLGRVNFGRDDGSLRTDGRLYGNGGGSGLGQIVVSTADPSGGSDGDIWLKV